MYRYDAIDEEMLADRAAEFREQCARRLAGELTEDQFKPLRLMNGLYLQLHAYMLRIAIPYGTLERCPAAQAGPHRPHLRQGLWPLHHPHQPPAPLDQAARRAGHPATQLAEVGMHAIQTSGNCIRNITADPYAGADRRRGRRSARLGRGDPPVVDLPPGVLLPAAQVQDRGDRLGRPTGRRPSVYDIGLRLHRDDDGVAGLRGAGRRRPRPHALSRPDDPRAPAGAPPALATCRRSCGSTTATAGATTSEQGADQDPGGQPRRRGVRPPGRGRVGEDRRRRRSICRTPSWPASAAPSLRSPSRPCRRVSAAFEAAKAPIRPSPASPATTSRAHKKPGYAIVERLAEDDRRDAGRLHAPSRWRLVADLAERYSHGRDPGHPRAEPGPAAREAGRPAGGAMQALAAAGLASAQHRPDQRHHRLPGAGLLRPGQRPGDPDRPGHRPDASPIRTWPRRIGELKIKISGCINACGHHHVGHIGILGVDKKGEEFYQLTLGGSAEEDAELGQILGSGRCRPTGWRRRVDQLVEVYLRERQRRRALPRHLPPHRPRPRSRRPSMPTLIRWPDGAPQPAEDPFTTVADDEPMPARRRDRLPAALPGRG